MSTYTNVFGGTTLYPSDVSYRAIALTADVTLEWPLEANGDDIVARVMDVTPNAAGRVITMPPADETAPGQLVTFNNLGADTFTVENAAGATILTVASGTAWTLYLRTNATAAGTWGSFQAGASTATAQSATLAGYGLTAIGVTLAQSMPVTTFNADYTLGDADRAGAFVWTGGVGTLSLPAASDAGDDFFVAIRNGGDGALTVDPAGADEIDGDSSWVLNPEDSAFLVCDGTSWYTVGKGQQAIFAFDYTSIDLTGEASPYVLASAELNRIAYKFVGTLTANMEIVVPGTIQQYWITNDTSGGSYTLGVRTAAQTPAVDVPRGSRGIYYSTGAEVVKADTASLSTPIAIADGGTGATTAGAALINLGGTAVGIAVFEAANEAAARTAIGSTATGDALFTAATPAAGRATLGSTVVGDAVFIAASQAAARAAIGAGTGSGDVVGPAAATANGVALYDSTTGKLLKDGPTIGTGNNQLVQLNGSGQLPAVSGALLTNLPASIPGVVRSARTANTILGVADKGTLIDVTSGTFSQTIEAAATLGSGWWCYYRNSGTGTVTLDPNGAETIGGAATQALTAGDVVIVQSDGTNLQLVWLNGPKTQFITSTQSVTVPGGCSRLHYKAVGGGGGGGKPAATNTASGGGAGGYCEEIVAVTPGASLTVTIGAAGVGATSGDANGTAGGDTTVGAFCTAGGGPGGVYNERSAAGGTATGGDININGGSGFVGNGALYGFAGASMFGQGGTIDGGGVARAATGYGSGGSPGYTSLDGGNGRPGLAILQFLP